MEASDADQQVKQRIERFEEFGLEIRIVRSRQHGRREHEQEHRLALGDRLQRGLGPRWKERERGRRAITR